MNRITTFCCYIGFWIIICSCSIDDEGCFSNLRLRTSELNYEYQDYLIRFLDSVTLDPENTYGSNYYFSAPTDNDLYVILVEVLNEYNSDLNFYLASNNDIQFVGNLDIYSTNVGDDITYPVHNICVESINNVITMHFKQDLYYHTDEINSILCKADDFIVEISDGELVIKSY